MHSQYDKAIEELSKYGFVVNRYIRGMLNEDRCVGIYIDCAPIMMDVKIKRMKKILGDSYVYTKYTALGEIYITEKA